jgi:lysophospholipase L1-like esterase
MKKIAAISAAAAMLLTSGCGTKTTESQGGTSAAESTSESAVESVELPEITAANHKENGNLFDVYQSNTVVATGNNNLVKKVDSVTYRAYFPVEQSGELEYCFYFSDEIDSTYNTGAPVHVGAEVSDYTIESARIADGGTSVDDEIGEFTEVTFGGNESREVKSGEDFWSDPVTFSVEEGHYLVWEWTLSGDKIPANNMSSLTEAVSSTDGEEFGYCENIPLPQLIGAKREAKYTVAAIGDSITQGCMTDYMAYEFWSAQISQKLGSDYAFWNCGLGWARTSDAATDGNWLERTKNSDIVIVAFGTNDIISGEYGGDGGNSAAEIEEYLRRTVSVLTEAGCTVVVFNAPPEDYDEEKEAVRTEYNENLEQVCAELGVYYFDFAGLLSDADNPSAAKYGGHPNGEAGGIVSDAFLEEYAALFGK